MDTTSSRSILSLVQWKIKPSVVRGSVAIPPSKSHTMRAYLFALLADGASVIRGPLESKDGEAAKHALAACGARIDGEMIHGVHGKMMGASSVIDVGNSGILLRFLTALGALGERPIVITGDASLCRRPMRPLIEALHMLGARVESLRGNDLAPLIVKGPVVQSRCHVLGSDSQMVSALLMMAPFTPRGVEIFVKSPGERPYVDLTLSWFDRLGLTYHREGYDYFHVTGNQKLAPFDCTIPSDFSTSLFPAVAALVTRSRVTLENLNFNDAQGDKACFALLKKMGAVVTHEQGSVHVQYGDTLRGVEIDLNDTIDALPALAVLACFAEGKTVLRGAAMARNKECDRIRAISQELAKMGAHIEERQDGLVITSSSLKGAKLQAHGDHRTALSLAIAALGAEGESTLVGPSCIEKTYPHFLSHFGQLGAHIEA